MSRQKIYLDYAAATPADTKVVAAMLPYFSENFYNPSAQYLAAKNIKHVVESARSEVSSVLGTKSSEIVFTAGATEANNLAIHGVMASHPDGNIITSTIEHESVLVPAAQHKHLKARVDKNGIVDINHVKELINHATVLISVMYANNEIGSVQPLREISLLILDIVKARQKSGNTRPLFLHTDASQAPLYLDVHVSRLGVDLMTINGGKIYGPKQSGVLFIKTGVKLEAQVGGGGQEKGIRSGTESVANMVGLSTALVLARAGAKKENQRVRKLKDLFIREVNDFIPTAKINGSSKHNVPSIVSVTIPGIDNERVMMQLDELGIMCAVGSACSASSEDPSHVLAALGMSEPDMRSTLRFSFGKDTTEANVIFTVKSLAKLAT